MNKGGNATDAFNNCRNRLAGCGDKGLNCVLEMTRDCFADQIRRMQPGQGGGGSKTKYNYYALIPWCICNGIFRVTKNTSVPLGIHSTIKKTNKVLTADNFHNEVPLGLSQQTINEINKILARRPDRYR